MEKKPTRGGLAPVKSFTAAEAKMVKYIEANAHSCGIPARGAHADEGQHTRTLKTQDQICKRRIAGPQKPTGPGLSEALGTTRGGGPSIRWRRKAAR